MNGAEDWDLDLERAAAGTGQVTDLMDRAAVLTRRDSLRRGNIVHLPATGDAVVLGDLHGDRENFDRVLEWAGLHKHRDRYLVLQEVIHRPARGPADTDESFRLLEGIARLKIRYKSQVQMVLSNHDLGEITGANMTKQGASVSEPFREAVCEAYGRDWEKVHLAYRRFLADLPLAVRTQNGVFISHSTPTAEALESFDYGVFDHPLSVEDCWPGMSVYELVWGRRHDQQAADRFAEAVGARLLVTGHQTSTRGVKTPTTRHIVLTSDGPLGRFLLLPLDTEVPHGALARQVMKISSLAPVRRRKRGTGSSS